MKQELVVARFNENLDWVKKVNIPVKVYNKGEPHPSTIQLKNVGRESHTYLWHILNCYDNLADFTVFCQGNPFDHVPFFLSELNQTGDFLMLGNILLSPFFPQWEEFYEKVMDKNPPVGCRFSQGAQIIVSKKSILSNPTSFYEKCLEGHYTSKNVPWAMEAMWEEIFTHESLPPSYSFVWTKPLRIPSKPTLFPFKKISRFAKS